MTKQGWNFQTWISILSHFDDNKGDKENMDCTRFGNKLNYYRERNDMTEKDLARKLGVTVRTIEKWENSEAVPNDRIIQRLSDMFGVDFWSYLDLDDKHGGSHDFDDEGDLSPFEILKEKRAGKTGSVQKTSVRSSDSAIVRKIISKILIAIALILVFGGEIILDSIPGLNGAEVIALPLAMIFAVTGFVIGNKK